jgi:hypothetical protein
VVGRLSFSLSLFFSLSFSLSRSLWHVYLGEVFGENKVKKYGKHFSPKIDFLKKSFRKN